MNNKQQFDLKLERYLLRELPPSEMKRMEDELKHNAELRGKLEALRRDTGEYFQKYPHLRSQQTPQTTDKTPWWTTLFAPRVIGGLALAATVIALVFFLPKSPSENQTISADKKQDNVIIAMKQNSGENEVRSKGNKPVLYLSVIRNAQKVSLAENDAVRTGEEIQIAYRASGYRYGVIVSVDAGKSVTLHFPGTETAPQDLKGGNAVTLPLAFKLDEKPGFEKFYFLASDKPLPLRQVMRELVQSGNLHKSVDPGVLRTTMRLKKE